MASETTKPATMIPAARLRRARRWVRARGVLRVTAWTAAFLATADVTLSVACRRPASPRIQPSALQSYVAYGDSTENKLRYLVRPTDAASGPLVPVGWVADGAANPNVYPPPDDRPARVRVSTFGMSFSNDISRHLHAMDPSVQVSLYAGPEAPPNHAFALYTAARALGPTVHPADVVVWGILAGAVKGTVTMTGDTWMFESPAPFCYPRYTLDGAGRLVAHWPTVRDQSDLRAALADPAKLAAFRDGLAAGDRFYDPLLFRATWADRSSLFRLLRRAYADHHSAALSARIETRDGFNPDDPDVGPVLRAMARQFAATAKADGRRPLLLLIQDKSSADHLSKLLAPALTADGVPFLSTHDLVSATDARNFVPDGHFTPAAYDRVAAALLAWVNAGRP